ncbi:MAG TPA: hypothetical protein DC000_00100 [Clostridiales bacterium]|nr:hypothetical protein [Clostridiales bacterium]
MTYNQLLQVAEDEDIEVIEMSFKGGINGLYSDNTIAINSNIETLIEKKCVLAEELGHHFTSIGNILDQKSISSRKQEIIARRWGYDKLISLRKLIQAFNYGCRNKYELADFLDITEQYLDEILKYFEAKYGLYVEIGDYCIYFNPLTIAKYNYE